MLASLLAATVFGAVPNVTAGPDLANQAVPTDAPITQVEVFSDRARVTRKARIPASKGVNVLRLPDLPGATWLDTLRADAKGATVLRVEAIPVQRERIGIAEVDALLVRLESQADALALLDAHIASGVAQLQAVTGLQPASPVPEKDRRGLPRWQPQSLTRVLDFFGGLRAQIRAKDHARQIQRRKLVRDFEKTQREVQAMNLGAFTDHKMQVLLLIVSNGKGPAHLTLTYDIPGAHWKPAYELHYDAKKGSVALESYAMVSQATGESWDNVSLKLSTSIPGRDIAVPELMTWTLGEAKEFIPRPRARTRPAQAPRYAAPQPGADRMEIERQARMSLLQQRLSELAQLTQVNVRGAGWQQGTSIGVGSSGYSRGGRSELSVGGSGQGSSGYGKASSSARPRRSRKKSRPRPAPPPMMSPPEPRPAMRIESTMEFDDDSISGSLTKPTGSVLASMLGDSSERVRHTSLSLFEGRMRARTRLTDPDLPAVSAAGFEYVYTSKTPMTIPSTGEALRAPLGRHGYPVSTFYEASPALAKNAYLKATIKNPGPEPILRGPVTIFVNGGFAGDGRLDTTAPGGTLQLPFGADEDIKLVYKVLPETKVNGVFSKDEVTTYKVVMEVANYKKRKITVMLREPMPRSQNEDIKIEFVKASFMAEDKDDANILRWKVTIAPGRTRSVEFVYKITRPGGWQLRQN